MGRVGMVLDLVAESVMGRVCQGLSLSWAEFVMGRDVPESLQLPERLSLCLQFDGKSSNDSIIKT